LVDLDVEKPIKRTAFGLTLCRAEYKLEISASGTDLWSSLLGSYFSLKSKVISTASIVAPKKQIYRELKGIPKILKQIYSYCFNRFDSKQSINVLASDRLYHYIGQRLSSLLVFQHLNRPIQAVRNQ
jgi:hypothetical protein